MPRALRHIVPGVTYHLISRFVAREFFISSDADRRAYLDLLAHVVIRTRWRLLAYAVMSNHIHLAMVAGPEPIATWLRQVHSTFADTVNRSRERIGALFVRGPKAVLAPGDGVGRVIAYLHNNPVRAGVCTQPHDSTWTSHRAYLGLEAAPPWLAVGEGMRRAGLTDVAAFEALVAARHPHPVLGEVSSDRDLEEKVDAYERACIAARRASATTPPPPATKVVDVVAHELGVTLAQLRSARRGTHEVLARQVAIVCGARLGCATRDLAAAVALTPQAVTKVLRTAGDGAGLGPLLARVEAALGLGRRAA